MSDDTFDAEVDAAIAIEWAHFKARMGDQAAALTEIHYGVYKCAFLSGALWRGNRKLANVGPQS